MGTKSQSAMEYLMTYGWAILAIAIVMVSLYSLGIFNTSNLAPTASPGSCEVVRTVAQTSLAGQCNGLMPKYVARFTGSAVTLAYSSRLALMKNFTIGLWVNPNATVSHYYGTVGGPNSGCSRPCRILIELYGPTSQQYSIYLDYANGTTDCAFQTANYGYLLNGAWNFVSATYNTNGTLALYINGTKKATHTCSVNPSQSAIQYLGADGWNAAWQGSMANVQIYNNTFDASSVKSLYLGGIGAVPVDVNHLIAWWPLNGNANDYSGYSTNGNSTGVVWNANWQTGYSQPKS